MLGDAWKLWAICALSQLGLAKAAAEPLPIKKSLELGRPARAVEVEILPGDVPMLHVGGSSVSLPARKVKAVELESIRVGEGAAVGLVRLEAENGSWLALLGGPHGKELLAAERADWHGDPGERRAAVAQRTAQGESGISELAWGTQYEGLARCGDPAPWLPDRRVVDPKTLKLVPRSPPARAASLPLAASAVQAANAPRLRLLTAQASSELDPITHDVRAPHALIDGKPDTTWPLASGALASLRWANPALAIERLELEFAHRTAPITLQLSFEGAVFDVSVPKPSGTADRVTIALPPETQTRCLSLAFATPDAKPVEIAEVMAFSAVDAVDGLERLVSDLIQDGPRGATAAELLPQLGEPAARAITSRFAELSARGQRRALRVLGPYLALPEARDRVLEAARSQDEALSQAAFDVLRRGGDPGRTGLRELAREPGSAGDRAATTLSQASLTDAEGLLAALDAPNGSERPTLRRALVTVAKREPDAFRTQAQNWLDSSPSIEARVGLALVAAHAGLSEFAAAQIEANLAATRFEDRFRLCLAAAQLGSSGDKVDAWLAEQAKKAPEWMERRAAYDALLARHSALASTLADEIAKDTYPRVRAASAPAFARERKLAPLLALAQKDPWPLVRAAAARGLGQVPQTGAALQGLLADSSRRVRAASIDALVEQKQASAWPRIEERLSAPNEWPEVQAAAVHFAAALCVQAARPALTEVARRALRPDANEDDRQLGLEAIRALHDLGGEADQDAQRIATRESATPQLQQAFAAFGPSRCTAQAAQATP